MRALRMLKKAFRLPIAEFKRNRSRTVSSEFFSLKFSPNKVGHNRFGVILSAKSVPKSTVRHLVKRKVIAFCAGLPNCQTDFLFVVLPSINNLAPKMIGEQVKKVFSKI